MRKDFNNIRIQGILYTPSTAKSVLQNIQEMPDWEKDIWLFVKAWLDDSRFVEVQTSGSTGKPKKLQIEKSKMLISARNTCRFFKLTKDSNALLCLPASHIGGMMMIVRAFYSGFNLWYTQPSSAPLASDNHDLDFLALVPSQMRKIIKEDLSKLKKVKNIIIGGGTIDSILEEKIKYEQINAYSTFGMTETVSHIALRKIGKETHYTCLEGIKVNTNTEGTLEITAPDFFEKTLTSNDLVKVSSSSTFEWLGRSDFAIESGGLKVIPEILEDKLSSSFSQNIVISSRKHPQLGNEIVLIIEGEEKEINNEIFNELTQYERPRKILFLEKLPRVGNEKIDRNRIKELIA